MPFNELRRFSGAIQSGKRVTECHQLSNIRLAEFAQGEYTGISCPAIDEIMMKYWVIAFLFLSSLGIFNPASATEYQQWLGWWRTPEQFYSIEIKPEKNGQLLVEGNGRWQHFIKLNDGSMERCSHHGQFGGILKPSGNILIYWPYRQTDKGYSKDHYIKMTLDNDTLIVDDQLEHLNNIFFSGTYQKYKRPKKR